MHFLICSPHIFIYYNPKCDKWREKTVYFCFELKYKAAAKKTTIIIIIIIITNETTEKLWI